MYQDTDILVKFLKDTDFYFFFPSVIFLFGGHIVCV